MKHSYTLASYKLQEGGYRGVILNRGTKERTASDVLPTLEAARHWAKSAIWEAIPDGAFRLAPLNVRGEYRANVWTAE
jgi:hypothetical protein